MHFTYFEHANRNSGMHRALGENEGVMVERISGLSYRVRHGERSVIFHLNPISQDDPPASIVHEGEDFVGRSFDESGVIFTLVFNHLANRFLWILDPSQMMEVQLEKFSHTMQVQAQSGFVFYLSPGTSRYVLAGVDERNVARNNYFDGPFDQLPDNWLHDTAFQSYVERMMPETKGHIGTRGEYRDGRTRVAIQPYMHYQSPGSVLMREGLCLEMAETWSPGFVQCLFSA